MIRPGASTRERIALPRQETAGGPVESSKHEMVYRTIRKRIVDGRYGPGFRLVFTTLARDLDVSPIPVREAIRRLEAEGLVRIEHNVGARVAVLDDEAWEHLVEMLALLDGYAVARASRRIPPAAVAEAQEINDTLRAGGRDGIDNGTVMVLHRKLHRTIYQYADNEYLVESLDRVWDRIDASRVLVSLYPAKRLATAVDEHDDLLARLRRGDDDPVLLERHARQHNLNAIIAIRDSLFTGRAGT
jgi:DNA-binding GntR family transcriptional regulator